MTVKHYIVYPDRRTVTEEEIRRRYADAVSNGEADKGYEDIVDIKAELESSGQVSFGDEDDFDDENIYGIPGIKQSIEEDRK